MNINIGRNVLIIAVVILLTSLLYQISSRYRLMLDFTAEKRYTLHPATRQMLNQLDEPIYIDVYLSGDLPPNFKRLQQAIRTTLEQFGAYAGYHIQYQFTDPGVALSAKARNEFHKSLIDKGLKPSNVSYTRKGDKTEKLIFPGVVINYRGEETAVNLLQGNRALSIDEMLNQSIEAMEYELAAGIQKAMSQTRKRVGFVTGFGEPDSVHLAGLTQAILSKYDLFRVNLTNRNSLLTGYDVLVIVKPTRPFDEKSKYLLDQFVMRGGRLLLFLDAMSVNMQEAEGDGTVALPYQLNLDDLLFRYGVRLNQDYLADINCGDIPVVSGMVGNQPRIELLPWPYFPVVTQYADHPLVRTLDATWFRGASSLDSVKAEGITKTPIMFTSAYTRVFTPPVVVSYNDLREKLRPEYFTSGTKTLGYLLEGKFVSLYKNRIPPSGFSKTEQVLDGINSAIIVVSDGDFVRNEIHQEKGNPIPIGVDPYTKNTYANEAFLLNALDYLTDETNLMAARNRTVAIRPLDKVKINKYSRTLVWINLGLPVILVIIFGIVKSIARKRKYGA